jgi:hypothetical protein
MNRECDGKGDGMCRILHREFERIHGDNAQVSRGAGVGGEGISSELIEESKWDGGDGEWN